MKNRGTIITITVIVVLLVSGGLYWYFLTRPNTVSVTGGAPSSAGSAFPSGFQPLNRPGNGPGGPAGGSGQSQGTAGQAANTGVAPLQLPVLRLLSDSPVGGYGTADSGASTTVRWIDRGRGNIYEADYSSADITTLSNTLVPRIYQSAWNADLSAAIAWMIPSGTETPSAVYAKLIPQKPVEASSTGGLGNTATPYELRGGNLPDNLIGYAASPDGKKLFILERTADGSTGYISPFDGSNTTKLFDSPLTQVNVSWPTPDIIAVVTKGSAAEDGYLYFVSVKTGVWTRIIGPLPGLSALVSHDGKYVIVSAAGNNNNILTSIYSVADKTAEDAVVRTLADKCVWGNLYPDTAYCAVPSQPVSGTYPDDWYKGTLSTVDKIWRLDAPTGEVHLVSSLVDRADRVIDAYNLGLDPGDNYLFFMNKNDLSLWSLDLAGAQQQ